jgi:hypothetical protein
MLKSSPFSNVSVTISGSNLWYKAFNVPEEANFDPAVSSTGVGNGMGFDFLTNVPIRRYGMAVKLTF